LSLLFIYLSSYLTKFKVLRWKIPFCVSVWTPTTANTGRICYSAQYIRWIAYNSHNLGYIWVQCNCSYFVKVIFKCFLVAKHFMYLETFMFLDFSFS
jgi:hypothetical protein